MSSFLVPSFLRLLVHLDSQGQEFKLFFRTFGTDLPILAKELNDFCEGRHPQFPEVRLDGSDGRRDLRLQTGAEGGACRLARIQHRKDGHFVLISGQSGLDEEGLPDLDALSLAGTAVEGQEAVTRVFAEMTADNHTFGLRDDYTWWNDHKRDGNFGKLLLLDPEDTQRLQLFVDDNIKRTPEEGHGIVDVRDSKTWEPIPPHKTFGRYVARCSPYAAVTDSDYYINLVQKHVAALRQVNFT
mmetsp:Transcript_21828/g.51264  ORF Transcript_21828/g.51264 Transcript_21828/m.51264 type:complete len:242 (+) Transcript_21828:3-728(+)